MFHQSGKSKRKGYISNTYHLKKLKQDQKSNINRPVTPSKIEVVVKILSRKRNPKKDGFNIEFYQTFK